MATSVLMIGAAGSGKTTALMDIIDRLFHEGLSIWDIGFCSYTRAAKMTAIERACKRFEIDPKVLESDGWFRTLHSICYRIQGLNSGRVLTKGKETKAWFKEWFDQDIELDPDLSTFAGSFSGAEKSDLEICLNLWNGSRQRLEPLAVTYERSERAGAILPHADRCVQLVREYEQMKRLSDMADFTDWLGSFAGVRFDPDGHGEQFPKGDPPQLTAWLLDEQQDNSALMDKCFRRLIEPARWSYHVGDPFQAVYAFNGSDPKLFQIGDYQKTRILDQSFRCPSKILELGEACLRNCSDYWDRKIKPAREGGELFLGDFGEALNRMDDPTSNETWLLLARTNFYAHTFLPKLRARSIPYVLTKGGSTWDAPVRNGAYYALLMLQQGYAISEQEWFDILRLDGLPVKFKGVELLQRGTKSQWKKRELDEENMLDLSLLIPCGGATQALVDIIGSGKWPEFFEFAPSFVQAIDRFGYETVFHPRVTVSTIHSAKGGEADNVVLLTAMPQIIHKAMQEQTTRDEEYRLAYVGVTRAKQRLWVVSDPRAKYAMDIPI